MINIPLTPELRKQIESALIETIEALDNELKVNEDQQDTEAISDYRNHIKLLESALETGIYNKTP